MKKIRSSKKGFTLAELLIVVAIIGVLVGISIPIFSAQLKKSRVATNQANARAAYAAAKSEYLDKSDAVIVEYTVDTGVAKTVDKASGTGITETAITKWGVDTATVTTDLDDKVATVWYVTLDDTGTVTAINGVFPA